MAQCSSPGSDRSSMNRPSPVRNFWSSTRRTGLPITSRGLLPYFFANQPEVFVDGAVRHQEEVCIAFVRRPGPVRDGEDVVLRPFERLIADPGLALAGDDQANRVMSRAPPFGLSG